MVRDSRDWMILLLGGALVAALVLPRAFSTDRMPGFDGGGGDADRGLIAVTGLLGSGESALYVIDTKTRNLAAYRMRGGKTLEFLGAREIRYDLKIASWNDGTDPQMAPGLLRRSWEELNRIRAGQTGDERKKEATPSSGAKGATPEGAGGGGE